MHENYLKSWNKNLPNTVFCLSATERELNQKTQHTGKFTSTTRKAVLYDLLIASQMTDNKNIYSLYKYQI